MSKPLNDRILVCKFCDTWQLEVPGWFSTCKHREDEVEKIMLAHADECVFGEVDLGADQ